MAETPTSTLALAKDKLRSAVAASAVFQAKLGVASADAALAKVYLSANVLRDGEDETARPFAVVATHNELRLALDSGGTKNYLRPAGMIGLYLTDFDRWPADPADSSINWDNFFGGVMDDLNAIAGLSDNLAISEISIEESQHSPLDRSRSQRPFWWGLLAVSWEN